MRYLCISCDMLRHNKSLLHLRLCQEMGKRCKTRQSFSYLSFFYHSFQREF